MSHRDRDPGTEVLLDLDGQVLVVDAKGGYWVRFSATLVEDFWAEVDKFLREKGVVE